MEKDKQIIKEFIDEHGSATDEILLKIKEICRELQPKGYIDKEDAKKILCDYLDFWMNRSF